MREHTSRRSRGLVIVEAAFVLPIVLMLALGAIEYGWLLLNLQRMTNAAREGARIAVLDYESAEADARSIVNARLAEADLSDDSPIVSIMLERIPGDPRGRMGETVSIIVPTTNLLIVNAPLLFPTPATLRAKVTMAQEKISNLYP